MSRTLRPSHRLLVAALLTLAALYAVWFRNDPHLVASMLVFALPPLVFAWLVWRGVPRAPFFAAVIALGWFSHGVQVAWIRRSDLLPASAVIVLAVIVVLAASLPGLKARFAAKKPR